MTAVILQPHSNNTAEKLKKRLLFGHAHGSYYSNGNHTFKINMAEILLDSKININATINCSMLDRADSYCLPKWQYFGIIGSIQVVNTCMVCVHRVAGGETHISIGRSWRRATSTKPRARLSSAEKCHPETQCCSGKVVSRL